MVPVPYIENNDGAHLPGPLWENLCKVSCPGPGVQQELGPRVCPFVRDSCLATSFTCHEGMGGTPPTGSACSSVPLLCGEQFTTGLGGCQGECRPLGPVASGVCISRFPSPFSPTTKLHPHMEETVQAHPPLAGVPKAKGCESLSPYSPVRACPQFLFLSVLYHYNWTDQQGEQVHFYKGKETPTKSQNYDCLQLARNTY